MTEDFNLTNFVVECLRKSENRKMTAGEIAEWIYQNKEEACREKGKKSKATKVKLDTEENIKEQISAEIGAKKLTWPKKNVKFTVGRPRQYYYSTKPDDEEVNQQEQIISQQNYTENDLYSKLGEFLYSEYNIVSKRIDDKKSKNSKGSGGNKWLFPDVVSLERLSLDWHDEINKFVKNISEKRFKLWSFEVKIFINRSNARETYFQAVSNSSWANLGYLVATDIDENAIEELTILADLHGIGIIRLDKDNPSESEIILSAKEKANVNWNVINRIAEENSDFLDYIKSIHTIIKADNWQDNELDKTKWDLIEEWNDDE